MLDFFDNRNEVSFERNLHNFKLHEPFCPASELYAIDLTCSTLL